ncbi:NAD(P)-dependent oxidoreductase [Clostridium sp. chh4-2]|uniref:NAD-dependent epimerase/dehydratase family protein n=1 Tax=Clostridium sp. chh4-2 TaxID=2067550 RepID=UPI000CCEF865|nr:NAD(P)-dependent oxidoreductase [Clostridium sp. chh4-2]PNV62559.1 NAD(P)-dependent oxidoreductase [Clostridium sp. chh4-2]
MKFIVTGATSFIGSHTVKMLLEQGHQVCAVVRPGSSNADKLEYYDNLSVVWQDLSGLNRLIEDKECRDADIFLHFGWDGIGSAGRNDPEIQKKNLEHSMQAVKTAQELGCGRFLFSGSQAEYGIHRDAMTETSSCSPVSEYGKAKLEFGRRAMAELEGAQMDFIHARIFSVYGPGDHPWSLVNTALSTFLSGGHMELGECTQKWNFLYIEDMAGAVISLALGLAPRQSGVYNIAGNDTRILREFVEEIYELCGKRGSFSYGLRPPNAEGPASLIPDIKKIEEATGWKPAVSFADGIRSMLPVQKE